MKPFSKDAYWQYLVPLEEVVPEPDNPTFKTPRAPTMAEDEAMFVPVKHNFDETFDRPVFTGKVSFLFLIYFFNELLLLIIPNYNTNSNLCFAFVLFSHRLA